MPLDEKIKALDDSINKAIDEIARLRAENAELKTIINTNMVLTDAAYSDLCIRAAKSTEIKEAIANIRREIMMERSILNQTLQGSYRNILSGYDFALGVISKYE